MLSKDGLDITGVSTAGLCVLLGMKDKGKWSAAEKEHLMTVLFAPTLIHRERCVHQDRFERLIQMLKALEKKTAVLGKFHLSFDKKTLDIDIEL